MLTLNKSEAIDLLREEQRVNKSRANGVQHLIGELEGESRASDCPLEPRRLKMERHIQKYWTRIRTQLPHCNGKCTTFGCPDGIVVGCWLRFKDEIL